MTVGVLLIIAGVLAVLLWCDWADEPDHLEPLTPAQNLDRAALKESHEDEP